MQRWIVCTQSLFLICLYELALADTLFVCKDETGFPLQASIPCPNGWSEVWKGSIEEYEAEQRRIAKEADDQRIQKEVEEAAEKIRKAKLEEESQWRSVEKGSRIFNSSWDGSVRQVKQYLEKTLKDPDSYQSIEWSPVLTRKNGSEYLVRHKYRAKNSFGGYVVNEQLFFLDRKGDVIGVIGE